MMRSLCPDCGRELPFGAPAGLCPSCLLGLAVVVGGRDRRKTDAGGPPRSAAGGTTRTETAGHWIGRYELLETIGEGGFGTVWMAEQTEPVRRKVGLKIIKLGMDTKEVVARFEAERQALAMMDHPNIARVFDGGATGSGRPYFVMELVKGVRITEYCDAKKVSIEKRLKLFIEVCQAVQHAHQKGIIHRDLKPSNVLVTELDGKAVPKVIDFGIAKATEQKLTEQTFFTRFNQVIGSPAYMSPEQAGLGSLDVDTRSDVYSLGVLLYELLTGHTPFPAEDLAKAAIDEVLRNIREKEPPKPSTRLSTIANEELVAVAEQRSVPVAKLNRLMRGELAWIVMKCLEKDRTRRYETAGALAVELQRYLNLEPVLARPPSTRYRAWKFCRKYRIGLSVAAMLLTSVVLAAVISITLMLSANQHRQRAEEAADALRHRVYASDMIAVQEALRLNNLGRAREVLERHRPRDGDLELRHWEWRYFWQESRNEAQTVLPQHPRGIRSLSFSADGRWLARSSEEGAIRLWDLATREEGKWLSEGAREPAVAGFSPRGDWIAAGVHRDLVKIWRAASGEEILQLQIPTDWIRAIAFSPDGSLLACMSDKLTIQLWDLARKNRIATTPIGPLRDIYKTRMAFAPHQPWLAVGETDGQVRILELPSLRERLRFNGVTHTNDGITSLAFSPDGNVLASASGYDGFAVTLWNPAAGAELRKLEGHTGWIIAVAFSPDGGTLASAGVDRTIRLWDTRTWQTRAVLRGHQHEIWALAYSPDGRTLASGSWAGEVFLWAASQHEREHSAEIITEDFRDVSFSSDGERMFAWHWDGAISVRSSSTTNEPRRLFELGTNNYRVVMSPDDRFLAVGSRTGAVRLLNPVTLREEKTLLFDAQVRVHPVGFSRDSQFLLTRHSPQRCMVWDVQTAQKLADWSVGPGNSARAISPDGQLVVTGDYDGTMHFWESKTGRELRQTEAHDTEVVGIMFSDDGTLLVSGSKLGDIHIWDGRTLSPAATLRGQAGAIYSLALSPDGKRLATSGNWEQALQIWDLSTRQIIATLPASGAMHQALQISPDGRTIVTIDSNNVLHRWRAPTFSRTVPR